MIYPFGKTQPTSVKIGDMHLPALRKVRAVYPIGDGRRPVLLETEEAAIATAIVGRRRARFRRGFFFAMLIVALVLMLRISWTVSRLTYEPPVMPASYCGVMV